MSRLLERWKIGATRWKNDKRTETRLGVYCRDRRGQRSAIYRQRSRPLRGIPQDSDWLIVAGDQDFIDRFKDFGSIREKSAVCDPRVLAWGKMSKNKILHSARVSGQTRAREVCNIIVKVVHHHRFSVLKT